MLVVKYGVPVAGMMSTWNAIPDRSSIVEPGQIGEFTHSSRLDLVAGVEEDAEERVAEVAVDDLVQRAAGLPDVQRPYHSATASKYGADEPLDVVARSRPAAPRRPRRRSRPGS